MSSPTVLYCTAVSCCPELCCASCRIYLFLSDFVFFKVTLLFLFDLLLLLSLCTLTMKT